MCKIAKENYGSRGCGVDCKVETLFCFCVPDAVAAPEYGRGMV